jgi:hypothetical protein
MAYRMPASSSDPSPLLSSCIQSGVPSSSVVDAGGAGGTLREDGVASVLAQSSCCSSSLKSLMMMTLSSPGEPSRPQLRSPNNLRVNSSSRKVSGASQSSSSSSVSGLATRNPSGGTSYMSFIDGAPGMSLPAGMMMAVKAEEQREPVSTLRSKKMKTCWSRPALT